MSLCDVKCYILMLINFINYEKYFKVFFLSGLFSLKREIYVQFIILLHKSIYFIIPQL